MSQKWHNRAPGKRPCHCALGWDTFPHPYPPLGFLLVVIQAPAVWPLTSPQLPGVYIQPGPDLQGLVSGCLDIAARSLFNRYLKHDQTKLLPHRPLPNPDLPVVLVTCITSESLLPFASISETSFFRTVLANPVCQQNLLKGSLNSHSSPALLLRATSIHLSSHLLLWSLNCFFSRPPKLLVA